jgi:hypothetical protein
MFIYSFRCQKMCVYVMITAVIIFVMSRPSLLLSFQCSVSHIQLRLCCTIVFVFSVGSYVYCCFSASITHHMYSFFHSELSDYQSTSNERFSDQFFSYILIIFNILQPSSVLCDLLLVCCVYLAWVPCMKPSSGNRLNLQEANSGELSGVWHCYDLC